MKVNDVARNREELDKVEEALIADRRQWLLRHLGSKAQGLRCWAFGSGWETRSVTEIPVVRIEEFAVKYA